MALQAALYEPFRELAERDPTLWLGPPARQGPAATADPPPQGVTINGVPLPHNVVLELRKLGIPLAFYHAGELQDAVNACAIDCTLVDDDEGICFHDKLTLNDNERINKPAFGELDRSRVTSMRSFGVIGFADRVTERSRAGPLPADI